MFRQIDKENVFREIRTPSDIINGLLLDNDKEDSFPVNSVQDMVRSSTLTKLEGQRIYYPINRGELIQAAGDSEDELLEALMSFYNKLQLAVSEVLGSEYGCEVYSVEKADENGNGFSQVRERRNLLLKEGNPRIPIPLKETIFPATPTSIYERLVKCVGFDGKSKFLKLVENLSDCPSILNAHEYTLQQKIKALVDTMKRCREHHSQNHVHRDIKPGHILVMPDQNSKLGVRGKLCDQELLMRTGMIDPDPDGRIIVRGTPIFADTEYYDYDSWAIKMNNPGIDIFAFGITLLELLIGEDYEKFIKILKRKYYGDINEFNILFALKKADLDVDIPNELFDIIIRMLKQDRYFRAKLREVIEVLENYYDLKE